MTRDEAIERILRLQLQLRKLQQSTSHRVFAADKAYQEQRDRYVRLHRNFHARPDPEIEQAQRGLVMASAEAMLDEIQSTHEVFRQAVEEYEVLKRIIDNEEFDDE